MSNKLIIDRVSTVPISGDGSTTRACREANGKHSSRFGSHVGRTSGNQGNLVARHNFGSAVRITSLLQGFSLLWSLCSARQRVHDGSLLGTRFAFKHWRKANDICA